MTSGMTCMIAVPTYNQLAGTQGGWPHTATLAISIGLPAILLLAYLVGSRRARRQARENWAAVEVGWVWLRGPSPMVALGRLNCSCLQLVHMVIDLEAVRSLCDLFARCPRVSALQLPIV